MESRKLNYYAPCDIAIKAMDRETVELFGRMKMAKWDEINVIRTVTSVYRESFKKARKRYFEEAYEAYILAMLMMGTESKKAHRMADRSITLDWVDSILDRTDFVTLYRFSSESERKAYRLAEQVEVSTNRNALIDRAMKDWSRQLGQYAINFADYAVLKAYEDAGVEQVVWVTEKDERRCNTCAGLDGMVFRIHEIPPKPHYGCRCRYLPVM